MKNLDQLQKERTEILQRMTDAVKENSTEGFSSAFDQLAELIQQNIIGEVREMQSTQDNGILAARGCRVLTSGEKQYYESVLEA
ncbi:MAG: phage major capsid protein, partial [Oscillospiraceae bacterium]